MKDSNLLADNATIKLLQNVLWLDIKLQYMTELNTHAYNVGNNFQERGQLLNTKGLFMKGSSTHAVNVRIEHPQREISVDTEWQYMKELNSLAGNATMKQLQSTKRRLAQHKKAVHEGVKYSCS